MNGKQVRLFLVGGSVGCLMTAEILNWTGHLLRGRRKDLGRIRNRGEAERTGVYILFGPNDAGGLTAYIGEGDSVATRLVQHDAKKDFWEDVVIITSEDMNLTKAHARYLESELIRLATSIGRVTLLNGTAPTGGAALPEADQSDMQYFINQIRILMPVLGFDIFRGRSTQEISLPTPEKTPTLIAPSIIEEVAETPDSPVFHMRTREGCNARAQIIDGEFTMLQGSIIPATMKDNSKMSPTTRKQFALRQTQHTALLESAIPGPHPELVTLSKDIVFSSPSAAVSLVYGRASANSRLTWKTDSGQTFGAWEEARSDTVPPFSSPS